MKKLPRKALVSLALAAGISAPIANPVLAAVLENLSDPPQACDGSGIWHFVNNQIPVGTAAGTLTADFDLGGIPADCITGPSAVNRKVQHFICQTVGDATLISASTNLPGKLVLSDVTCTTKPPVCEPEKGGEVCDGRDNDCDGLIDEDLICK